MNYSNIASDVAVSEPTVKSYYEILEDTLLGFQLMPWRKGRNRKAVASNKFYFFDTGILHTVLRSPTELDRNSDIYGKTFEQFIAQEIRAYISYQRLDVPLNYWRTLRLIPSFASLLSKAIKICLKTLTKPGKTTHLAYKNMALADSAGLGLNGGPQWAELLVST